MKKGISPTVSIVLLIAVSVIAVVGLYFFSESLVVSRDSPEKPIQISIRPVDPSRGVFLITNGGDRTLTLSEIQTDVPNVNCSFNGSSAVVSGNSAPCYMPPKAGSVVSLYGEDDEGIALSPASINIGFDSVPSVSFFKEYDDSYSWSTEVVDNTSNVGKHSAIAVDSDGKIHIVYYNEGDTDIYHAQYDGSSWTTTLVDSTNPAIDVGKYASIDVDSNDNLHVSYYDETRRELKHAEYNGTAWTTEGVETGNVSGHTSIAIDTDDTLHVSYYDGNNRNLKHAEYGESWTNETVDSGAAVGKDTSIGLYSNRIYISYLDEDNNGLKLALYDESWDLETITYSDNFRNTSLCMGSGSPHVIAWNQSGGGLFDFYQGMFIGTWSGKIVDANESVGQYNSITFGSDELFHASYYDSVNGDLKYAKADTGLPDVWEPMVIESIGDVGKYTSITNGTNNTLHISYYDETNDVLKHAEYSSGKNALVYTVNDAEGLEWVALKENGITVANSSVSNCDTFYTSEYPGFKSSKTYTVQFKNCLNATNSKTYS